MEADPSYSGVDNLEVMAAARRYNAFLLGEVLAHCPGVGPALDFGAGIGTFAQRVRAAGIDVTCIETDPAMAARLGDDGFEVHRGFGPDLAGKFGYAYSLNVLEHIEDDRGALRGLYECLRPGGKLYVFVPAFPILYSSMDRKVGHVRRYTRSALLDRLQEAGFVVETWSYADSLGFAASLAFRWIGNASGDIDPNALKLYDRFAFPLSRAVDTVAGRWFGKNLAVVARRPSPG